jgi:predicted Zn-dependent protease
VSIDTRTTTAASTPTPRVTPPASLDISFLDRAEAAFREVTFPETAADIRVSVSVTEANGYGIEENRTASVYSPPTAQIARGGGYLVKWGSGELSRGDLSVSAIGELASDLRAAAARRYQDEAGGEFHVPAAQPVGPPPPPVATVEIDALIDNDGGLFADLVARAIQWRDAAGGETVNAKVNVRRTATRMWFGSGYRCESYGNRIGFSAGIDADVHAWASLRTPLTEERLDAMGTELIRWASAFRAPRSTWTQVGESPVLFTPDTAGALLDKFLFGHLSAAAIYRGTSRHTIDDVRAGAPCAGPAWTVKVDPTIPLASGAYPFTAEGVRPFAHTVIENGKIAAATAGAKYAARLGLPITPSGFGDDTTFLDAGPRLELSDVSDGVIVFSVLSLHTADATRGDISLNAPSSLRLEKGAPAGRLNPLLVGNFFDVLNDPRTRLVNFPAQSQPGLLAHLNVRVS